MEISKKPAEHSFFQGYFVEHPVVRKISIKEHDMNFDLVRQGVYSNSSKHVSVGALISNVKSIIGLNTQFYLTINSIGRHYNKVYDKPEHDIIDHFFGDDEFFKYIVGRVLAERLDEFPASQGQSRVCMSFSIYRISLSEVDIFFTLYIDEKKFVEQTIRKVTMDKFRPNMVTAGRAMIGLLRGVGASRGVVFKAEKQKVL